MEILKVENLCKTYGKGEAQVKALQNAGFSMQKGEFAAVVGESGSGKTTLLNILAALDKPTAGSVLLNGKDITKISEKQLAKFQYLSDELESVTYPASQTEKVRITEIEQEIGNLLAKVPEANKTVMEYINRQIEELDKEKQVLQQKLVEQSTNQVSRKMDKITNYIAKWDELNNDDKQRVADILIDRIDIDEDVIEITWNI